MQIQSKNWVFMASIVGDIPFFERKLSESSQSNSSNKNTDKIRSKELIIF